MNVLDATRAWMRAQCPLINKQDLFNANYLGAEPTEYTLRTASESHRTDVLGYDLAEYSLTFVAQLPFGRELKPNLDAADFSPRSPPGSAGRSAPTTTPLSAGTA